MRLIKNLFISIIYFVLRYLIRYQKSVVEKNIDFVFQDKPQEFKNKVKKGFYRYFSVVVLDALTGFIFPFVRRKLVIENSKVLKDHAKANQSVVLTVSHYSGYEAASVIPRYLGHPCVFVYKPQKNKFLDSLLKRYRSRKGAIMVAANDIYRYMLKNKNKPIFYFFVADGYPGASAAAVDVSFFNKKIKFISGPAVIAKKLNLPYLYTAIEHQEYGAISICFKEYGSALSTVSESELTQWMVSHLEQQIQENSSCWFWYYKRFRQEINYR